jgi:hypothetical protein
MNVDERARWREEAASQFDLHEQRSDGARVASILADGLSLLRDSFFTRVHGDVERIFGLDSMLSPVSVLKSEASTNTEIEVYLIVESALDARGNRYVSTDDTWSIDWLSRLWLGDAGTVPAVVQLLSYYAGKTPDDRRRAFSTRLQHLLPETGHAPLIMYRLFPLAVSIATAIAFGDHSRAEELRKRQITWLPSIADCHACHGRLLENGEKCQQCGNPFWKYDWLTAD